VTPEVRLRVALPAGAEPEPEAALPAIDVSSVPGAAVSLRRGFQGAEGVGLRVICARAPSDRWAPGVEELVLGRVNALTQGSLGGEVERFDAAEIAKVGARFEQRFEGAVTRPEGARVAVRGRHLLGFAGEAKGVVLCTAVCVEPAAPANSAAAPRCAPLIDAVAPEGAFTEAPPPSALIRSILLAAEHPLAALGIAAAAALALVAWVLARRPRPRW
jgi:hypothetical protein